VLFHAALPTVVSCPCPQVYRLPPERLYATYFQGDPKNGIPAGVVLLMRQAQYCLHHHLK
jgi:hypothetical protein